MAPEGSSRPLAAKLGVRPGTRILLVDAPPTWSIDPLPSGATTHRSSATAKLAAEELVIAFFREASSIEGVLEALAPVIYPDGGIWAAWPRRAGGHQSDITDNVVRAAALALGLVDIKVAAIDPDWSGLRLVWRRELRGAGSAPSVRDRERK